jgi:hypothetical protein
MSNILKQLAFVIIVTVGLLILSPILEASDMLVITTVCFWLILVRVIWG